MRRPALLLFALVASLACRDGATALHESERVPPPLPGLDIASNGLSAEVIVPVNSPTTVRVRYLPIDGHGDTLETTAELSATDSTLRLDALKPGHVYEIQAAAVDAHGHVGPTLARQVAPPPLPTDLADFGAVVEGAPTVDGVMFEVRANSGFQGFVVVDRFGEIVWYYRTVGAAQGAARLPNGNFVFLDGQVGLQEVDASGAVIHTLDATTLSDAPHHDVLPLADTSVLYLARDRRTVGTSTIALEAMWEWNPVRGTVRKRWSAWDMLDPSVSRGTRSYPSDWLHANSLALGPHGNILISLTWIHQVLSLSPDFSRIEWTLGGPGSTYTFTGDAAFNGQHAASMTAEGRVLLFDNGRDREDGSQWSRGLELDLDATTGRAATRWQFRPVPDNYAPFLGYARRLSNGNTWVHFGLAAGPFNDKIASGPIIGYDVNSSGVAVGSYRLTNSKSAYRSWPVDHIGDERRVTP